MQILAQTPPPVPKRPQSADIKLTNIADGETVHQRFLLVNGRATAGHGTSDCSHVVVVETADFPDTTWPCVDSYFKALVHLCPGPNTVTFRLVDECNGRPVNNTNSSSRCYGQWTIHYLPLLENPALQLCIFIGRDSPETFDVPPQKAGQNTLAVAISKLRLAGYLWQAFCAEQMYRHGMGRRTFRLEEEALEKDTTGWPHGFRSHKLTAVVHVIRSRYTVAEIRDVRRAQQSPNRDPGVKDLFGLFLDDLRDHPVFRHPCYVAGLILDAHWDGSTVLGHAALGGGGGGGTRLGIFGSHLLHAWPQHIQEMVPCMLDTTPTDTRYVANDANESGEWWRALNIGMGAMLHEVGHAFTLSHTASGIMSRGYNNWNRTFVAKEPGLRPIPPEAEAGSHWHRVDIIRLRYHPAFRLPSDPPERPQKDDRTPDFMPLSERSILVRSPGGLTLVEVIVNGQYRTHHEYHDAHPSEMVFDIVTMIEALKLDRCTDKIRLEVTTANQCTEAVDDVLDFLESHVVMLPDVPFPVLKSDGFGHQGLGAQTTYQVIFPSQRQIIGVRVHYGSYVDGIVFRFDDGTEVIVGKRGGAHMDFWLRPDERIAGMWVRCGAWVDGLQVVTSQGRRSAWFGGTGGGLHWVSSPEQYKWVGLYGSAGPWLDQIGIYYASPS